MLYKDWKVYYKKILDDFDFEIKKDIESAKLLDELLSNKNIISLSKLQNLLKDNKVAIFGAGHSLTDSLDIFRENSKSIKIAADGATSALIKKDIIPEIILTDLDGYIPDQIKANKKGSIVIIHAHGDNIDKIKKYVPKFHGELLGSTQADPSLFKNIYNFGGFTDGDRCIFLADQFKAKKIILIGFDYDKIGKYSFYDKKNKKIKFKKLRWCKYLIDELKKQNFNIEYL